MKATIYSGDGTKVEVDGVDGMRVGDSGTLLLYSILDEREHTVRAYVNIAATVLVTLT